jgi:hypothetical protein
MQYILGKPSLECLHKLCEAEFMYKVNYEYAAFSKLFVFTLS